MRTQHIAAGLAICALVAAGYAAYRAGGGAVTAAPAPGIAENTQATSSDALKPHRVPPPGQQELYSEKYRFSVLYPSNLSVRSYDEGGGATTISLQDVGAGEGFQIFITPYAQAQVSEERFAQDEPSGVRKDPLDIAIGGVTGSSFYSTNAALGDTAEIWFIQGGYLFEATAPKSEAQWFSNIMMTWQFI